MRALLQRAIRSQVYPITGAISQGPFVSPLRADDLRDLGVTHVLNVSECASDLPCGVGGFREVA